MKHYYQPKGSTTCGQHCVAMLCNVSVEDSQSAFKKKGRTKAKDLHEAISKFGYQSATSLLRLGKNTKLPDICILRVKWNKLANRGHWVIYNKGVIYCSVGGIYLYSQPDFITERNGKFVSYLDILSTPDYTN